MASNSRSKNASLNIFVGIASQIIITALAFIGRRIFVDFLSADYLGINGLYGNILSVLALAELGLGNVAQFFLYKPVADRDEAKITSLTKYFGRLYAIIAAAVLAVGLALIPFLRLIIKSDLPFNMLVLYYVIFLVNSAISYFSAAKIALLAANQDNRLQKYVAVVVNIAFQLIHIFILAVWHSFLLYIVANVVSTAINVIAVNIICEKRYPYLRKHSGRIAPEEKRRVIDSIKSTFIYKIGGTLVNNTDNILISVIVSTAAVGLYSNYYMVINAVQTFVTIVTLACISGIGNMSAGGDKKKMLGFFKTILLGYHFLAAFCAISFFLLFRDLIPIWLGNDYLFGSGTVFVISLNFYLTNAIAPVYMFRESNGMFSKVKYLLLTMAGVNIVLSIVLGKLFGILGILLATALSRILTQVWYEPRILFGELFMRPQRIYWLKQARYAVLTVISAVFCWGISSLLPHNFIFMVIKGCIFFVITTVVFTAGTIRTNEFKEIIMIVKRTLGMVLKKRAKKKYRKGSEV